MNIPKLPDTDTQAWEDMVAFMREDLDNNMMRTRLILEARELLKSQGRDFNDEFAKWKEKQNDKQNQVY